MSLLLNMHSRLVITFLPRSKRLLISWLQAPSVVILEPRKIKSDTVSTVSPSISPEVVGPDAMIFVFWMYSDYTYVKLFNTDPQVSETLIFLLKISPYSQFFFMDNFYWSIFRFRVSFHCHLPMVIMLISWNFNFRYCIFYLLHFYPVLLYHFYISVILFFFHSTQVCFPLHDEA